MPTRTTIGQSRLRRGFTLFEVILALGLSVTLLSIVWMAVDLQLRLVDVGRTEVEQAQLARSLLTRIADDLRSAVVYQPQDTSGVTNLTAGIPSADDLDALDPSGSASAMASESTGDTETTASTTLQSEVLSRMPGLYGSQYDLQVDVSRLPRFDQYVQPVDGAANSAQADAISDVKTVAYFLRMTAAPVSSTADSGLLPSSDVQLTSSGLVRRERDRAATLWATEQGNLAASDMDLEPIAPEVVALEFQYYDGTAWVSEWDSDARGGLPVAVEVAIALQSPNRDYQNDVLSSLFLDQTSLDSGYKVYRLLVHLPAALPTTLEEANTEEPPADESETQSDQSGGV